MTTETTTHRRRSIGSPILASSGWFALAATWLPSGFIVRPVIVAIFVMVGPGASLTATWPSRDPLERAVVAVAASLAIAVIVAEAQAYAGLWSPRAAIAVLALLTTCATTRCRCAARRDDPASKEPA